MITIDPWYIFFIAWILTVAAGEFKLSILPIIGMFIFAFLV